ncbi:MAG: hypothetical protein JNL62_29265 [Bryobacterales bacterium]|nr:hypothetical protein [Bryobacterales bacterium]
MFRTFFASIQINPDVRFGIELALNQAAKKQFLRVRRVLLHGVSNTHKEEKMGFVQGTAARTKMYAEIAKALVQTRNREIATRKRKQRRSKNGRRLL